MVSSAFCAIAIVILLHVLLCAGGRSQDTAFPTGVYVTDVTATSANVHWRAEGQRRGRGKGRVVEYEVICAGLRRYTTASGECDLDTDSVVRSVPEGQNHVFLGPLRPNFNYSCAVLAESTSGALSNSVPCFFSTDYGAPEAPQAPEVYALEHEPVLEIKVFPTSTKHGPIDGYEVQFHVMNEMETGPNGVPVIPIPLLKPEGPIASLTKAQGSPHPLSFRISYMPHELPKKITIGDGVLSGALKNRVSYTVVTVAYTRARQSYLDNFESPISLYTSSAPTMPFFHSQEPVPKREKFSDRPLLAALIIVCGVVMPMMGLIYVGMVVTLIACWEHRMRLTYMSKSPTPMAMARIDSATDQELVGNTARAKETDRSTEVCKENDAPVKAEERAIARINQKLVENTASLKETVSSAVFLEVFEEDDAPEEGATARIDSAADQELVGNTLSPVKETVSCTVFLEACEKDKQNDAPEEGATACIDSATDQELVGNTLSPVKETVSCIVFLEACEKNKAPEEGATACIDSATDQELVENTASLKETVSSTMFLPRGLSSGPFQLRSPNAIRNYSAQLSSESSVISDQAPELEMEPDVFGMGTFQS